MAQRILKLLNTMSGKFQKFNFRKLVFKKRKDRRFSQESLPRGKSKETSGFDRRPPTASDFDVSLRRGNPVAAGADSEARYYDSGTKRYEPKFVHLRGPQKATNDVLSSAKEFNELPKRRSKTVEPKSVSMIDEPLSCIASTSRNAKEATWEAASTSPFVYQKSISTPCMGMKKTVKSATSDFDGLAVGWPSLRTWDVPGPKARFPASTVEPANVPSSNKINDISMSWNNVTQEGSNNFAPLSSDNTIAKSKRAKKLYALKLITGEIWNPEPGNVPYLVDQELSENSPQVKIKPIISNPPTAKNVLFQDKAGKILVDTVKKVVSTDSQPTNEGLNTMSGKFQNVNFRRLQANNDRNKTNFSKQARIPSVGASRAYSDTNNIYLTKLKNSEHKVPRYRNVGKQMEKGLDARYTLPITEKVADAVGASTLPYRNKMPTISGGSSLKETQAEQKTVEKTLDSTAPFTGKGASNLKATKVEQKTANKPPDSAPTITEKGRSHDGWLFGKMSDFVLQKLKKMSDFATSNLKPTVNTLNSPNPAMKNLQLNVKKVPEIAKQTLKSIPDTKVPNLNGVKELSGEELKNITEFARPIPKKSYEFLKPTPKNVFEFAKPVSKTVSDTARLNSKKIPDPNFDKDKGFAWSNSINGSKFIDQNLKTFQVAATTDKKFPYFEVVNTQKEYNLELPNNFVRPNLGNKHDILHPKTKKDSENPEAKPKIAPIPSETIAAKEDGSAALSKHEMLFVQEGSNISKENNSLALNSNKGSEKAETRLEKITNFAEPEEKQVQTIEEPIEGNVRNVIEAILKKEPDVEIQNPEGLPEHSEPNLRKQSEFDKENLKEAAPVAHSDKTLDLDATKVEIIPELDQLKLKQLPDSLPPIKNVVPKTNLKNTCKTSQISKVGNQFSSIISDKDSNSILKTLDKTAEATTSENIKYIPKVSGEIENKPPVYTKNELEQSWKIYVVHNAQGKGSNSDISQYQNTNIPFSGKPTNFIPEIQTNHTFKKMINSSHNPPSTSYGTETLVTTRKINSTNLQNYPLPQLFNQMERGENKFLVFWKGREDTNLFSNLKKKPSFILPPQSPRRIASNDGKAQKSVAEKESLSRKFSSGKCVQPPSEISSSCTKKSSYNASKFLPVVCVPSETLPCVVSNLEPEEDGSEEI